MIVSQWRWLAHLRVLFDETAEHGAARVSSLSAFVAPRERSFRRRLVATPARRQKNDGGQQIVRAKRRQKLRGRHLRHAQFQRGPPPATLSGVSNCRTSRRRASFVPAFSFSISRAISGFKPPGVVRSQKRQQIVRPGRRNAARKGTGRAPGRATTPQRTPRTSEIHEANSAALPIVAESSSRRTRGGDRMIASSQTWPRSSSAR